MSSAPIHPEPRYKKKKIPKAIREALWISFYKGHFKGKCQTPWCPNEINAYNFQAGHNLPESRGGATTLDNLVPICARCNLSMGSSFTFDEWVKKGASTVSQPHWLYKYFCFCSI